MRVNIDNKDIELKYSFRAYMIYENITDHAFQPTSKITDFIILFYSTVMASDSSLTLDYEVFIDWLDEHPDEINNFTEWLTENINKNNALAKKVQPEGDSDSKN